MAQAIEKRTETQPEPASNIIQIIERAASDPNVDVEKWERLIAMHERMEDRAAEKAFNIAKTAAQKAMPAVVRDADNQQTRSKYARLETISDAIDPVITEHGFSTTFSEGEAGHEDHLRILCDLAHIDGHTKRYHVDVPIDATGLKGNPNKTKTHAHGSTLSYGRRYLKCMIFDVQLRGEDDDGNEAGNRKITEDQLAELEQLAETLGIDKIAFCRAHNLEALGDLAQKFFNQAKTAMVQKAAKDKEAKQ